MHHTRDIPTLTLAGAQRMVERALTKAEEMGVPVVIAVVDQAGDLKAYTRMDGAPLLCIRVAQDKAWSAAAWDTATHKIWDKIKDEPAVVHGLPENQPRLTIFGGGIPVVTPDGIAGAIGVSGGSSAEDQQIAEAGVAGLQAK